MIRPIPLADVGEAAAAVERQDPPHLALVGGRIDRDVDGTGSLGDPGRGVPVESVARKHEPEGVVACRLIAERSEPGREPGRRSRGERTIGKDLKPLGGMARGYRCVERCLFEQRRVMSAGPGTTIAGP
jgi:hypothetical protein